MEEHIIQIEKEHKKSGFTLIELLVVIAIIGLLASIVLASVNSARKKGRDTRRMQDIRQIYNALHLYYADNKSLPAPVSYGENSTGGFDVSYEDRDGDGKYFLDFLQDNNYMPSVPVDPINDATHFYRYYFWTWDPTYADCKLNWFLLSAFGFETLKAQNDGLSCYPGSGFGDYVFSLGEEGL